MAHPPGAAAPLAINIGAAARLGISIAAISAGCLSVLAMSDTWYRFRAELTTPSPEGVVNLFGGLALRYKQFCPKYGNSSLPLGQPLIAPVQCLSQDLALDGSDGPNYNTTYNKWVMASLGITIAACIFIVFLALSAPSEKARRAWMSRRATGSGSQNGSGDHNASGAENGGLQIQATSRTTSASSFSFLIPSGPQHASFAALGITPPKASKDGCFARSLGCVETAHNNLVSLLPLHAYIPLVALPCAAMLIVLSTLWVDGANHVGTDTLITTITGYVCADECEDGYNTIPGPGAIGALTASLLLFVSSMYLGLRWAFPACCPSLLDLTMDPNNISSSHAGSVGAGGKRKGAYGSSLLSMAAAAAANAERDPLDGIGVESESRVGRASFYDEDDDDDDEDEMFIRIKSPIVGPQLTMLAPHNSSAALSGLPSSSTGAPSATTNSSSSLSAITSVVRVPGITTIGSALGGMFVVKDDATTAAENGGAKATADTDDDEEAVGVVSPSIASASSASLGHARKQAVGPAVASPSETSVLPMLLHRMSMSEPQYPGSNSNASSSSGGAADVEGTAAESLLRGGAGSVPMSMSSLAGAPAASVITPIPSLVPLSTGLPVNGGPAWSDIEGDRNPEVTLEHASVAMHPGAATVFRVISVVGMVLTIVAYGTDWWTFSFNSQNSGGRIQWYGGLGINSLTIQYPQTPSQNIQLTVFLRYAFQPIQSLAAPTIIAAFFITVAVVCACCVYGVMQPYENVIIRALLFSPCRRCKCARGGVMGQTTVELKEMLQASSSSSSSAAMPWSSITGWEREHSNNLLGKGAAGGDQRHGASFSSIATGAFFHTTASNSDDALLFVPPQLPPALVAASSQHASTTDTAAAAAGSTELLPAAAPTLPLSSSSSSEAELDVVSTAHAVVGSSETLNHPSSDAAAAPAKPALREARIALILLHSCRAVDRVAAACRFAHLAAFSCLFAALLVVICAGAFDWDSFLFAYLDPMHDPNLKFHYSLGPSAVVLLTATAVFLGCGFSLYALWRRRFRNLMILLRAAVLRGEEL